MLLRPYPEGERVANAGFKKRMEGPGKKSVSEALDRVTRFGYTARLRCFLLTRLDAGRSACPAMHHRTTLRGAFAGPSQVSQTDRQNSSRLPTFDQPEAALKQRRSLQRSLGRTSWCEAPGVAEFAASSAAPSSSIYSTGFGTVPTTTTRSEWAYSGALASVRPV